MQDNDSRQVLGPYGVDEVALAALIVPVVGLVLGDVPILRPLAGLAYFCTVPGLHVLTLVGVRERSPSRTLLYASTLSLLVVAGVGLLGVFEPTAHVLLLSGVTLTLSAVRPLFASSPTQVPRPVLPDLELSSATAYAVVAVPILAVAGSRLLYTTGQRVGVYATLGVVALYVIYFAVADDVPTGAYPLAIFAIGVGMALLHGLRSPFLSSNGDLGFEYYLFRTVVDQGGWNPVRFTSGQFWERFNGLLSITVIPASLHLVSGLDEYVYKLVYRVFEASIPLSVFLLFRDRLGDRRAFLAAAFLPFQFVYVTLLGTVVRTLLAFVFMFVAFVCLFDDGLTDRQRWGLFVVFAAAVVVSHYTSALILLAILGFGEVWKLLLGDRESLVTELRRITPARTSMMAISVVTIAWYVVVSPSIFLDIVEGIQQIGKGFQSASASDFQPEAGATPTPDDSQPPGTPSGETGGGETGGGETGSGETGSGESNEGTDGSNDRSGTSVVDEAPGLGLDGTAASSGDGLRGLIPGLGRAAADTVTRLVYYSTIGTMLLGALAVARGALGSQSIDDRVPYTLAAVGVLGVSFVVTRVYTGYGPFRAYFQTLVFLAPAFVVGVGALVGGVERVRHQFGGIPVPSANTLVAVFLVVQLVAGTYGIFQLFGVPYGEVMNDEGERFETSVTQAEERAAAQWVCANGGDDPIWADYYGEHIVAACDSPDARDRLGIRLDRRGPVTDGYVYLRCDNTRSESLSTKYEGVKNRSVIEAHIAGKAKVYSSGCSRVYR